MSLNSQYSIGSLAANIQSLVPGILVLGTPACLIATDQTVAVVNQAYLDLTGRSSAEIIGKRLQDLIDVPGYEISKPYFDHAIAGGAPARFTRLGADKSGNRKWISVIYTPVHDDESAPMYVLAQITQLEDGNELDDALIERERLLRHLTDDTGRPILYVDENLLLCFVNKPFLTWIGNKEPNLIGKHASTVLPKAAYEFYRPFVCRCLAGTAQKVETLSLALAGPQRHMRIEFIPDVQQDGRIAGVYIVGYDIEEDFQLRQSLLAKQREIRSVMDSVAMPLCKSDRDLRYLYVNQVACDWFGLREDQIIGKHWSEVIGAGEFAEIQPFAARAVAGEVVTFERFTRFPGRAPGQVRVSMFPERGESGDVTGVYVVITDIERDHQLKQQLIDRERQLRLITDNIGLPISYIGADHCLRFYNKTGEEWLGLKEADVLGKSMNDAFGANIVATVEPYLAAALGGEPTTYERLANFPLRGERWVRGHLVPDTRSDGSVAGIYTVLTDIHDDVMMRESLQLQERQLRLFTDNIPESIAYLDPDRRYRFVNNTFLKQRGRVREDVIGHTSEEVLGHEAAELAAPYVRRALVGETVIYERLVPTVGGGPRWHRIRTVPDFAPNGRVQGLSLPSKTVREVGSSKGVGYW